jgi:membrane-associated two-gene conflict system component 1 (EACC1)
VSTTETVTVGVEGTFDNDAELRSLFDWLSREDALDGTLQWAPADVRPGDMGAVTDVLLVALGSGSAGAVLARSVSVWLTTRRADVKVKISTARGVVEMDARRVRDPESLIVEVSRLLDDGDEAT